MKELDMGLLKLARSTTVSSMKYPEITFIRQVSATRKYTHNLHLQC